MRIYRTPIREGETMFDAICRAGVTANEGHFDGYQILCNICNEPVEDHENPGDCQRFIWARQFLEKEKFGPIAQRERAQHS